MKNTHDNVQLNEKYIIRGKRRRYVIHTNSLPISKQKKYTSEIKFIYVFFLSKTVHRVLDEITYIRLDIKIILSFHYQ